MRDQRPTLLIFTLGAPAEARRRALLPRPLQALEVAFRRSCLELILALGRACGCRLEVSSPHPVAQDDDVRVTRQRGSGFGSRFRRALRQAFSRPEAGPVLAVGTDVPGLESRHLQTALDLLDEDPQRVVLGPCPDGGFYLLAAARPLEDALAQTSWCRASTMGSLIQALEERGRPVVLLSPLTDLDRPADLERWLASEASRLCALGILPVVRALLASHRRPPVPLRLARTQQRPRGLVRGRAPPTLAFATPSSRTRWN